MKKFKKQNIDVLAEIMCDVCGKSCTYDTFEHEYATLEAVWGYSSSMDTMRYEIHLCENCFKSNIKYLKERRNSFNNNIDLDIRSPLDGK